MIWFLNGFLVNMYVLTTQIDAPDPSKLDQYGMGVWMDIQRKQSYFYFSTTLNVSRLLPFTIYRLNISSQTSGNWELVGEVDFTCHNVTVSPCKQYFWAMEVHPRRRNLVFRQINPKTLEYETFGVSDRFLICLNNRYRIFRYWFRRKCAHY